MLEHHRLVDYLEKEMQDRNLSYVEFAALLGMSAQQYYNIRSAKQPGLQICLDIARALHLRPDYVLYLAGHITEDELNAPQAVPAELLPTLNKLQRLKGTPFFTAALDLVEDVVDKVMVLFKLAA